MKKILITGASGFVGSVLNRAFTLNGFEVRALSRSEINEEKLLLSLVNGSYAIFNLAGANIINRWSDTYKETLYNSRIETTRKLVKAIENASSKPEVFISTSAVGIYKDDKVYDEYTKDLGNDFLAKLCIDWEREALKAKEFGVRVSIFRYSIILGEGGAMAKMLLPFKLGLGGTIGNGKQALSFIHIDDLVSAYSFVLNNMELNGIFNLSSPNCSTNYEMTKALGKYLNRPTILPVPVFMLNILFGEGAKVLSHGQSAIPTRLIENGFEFKYENIDKTIKNIVEKRS